jgi:hypothetical protein
MTTRSRETPCAGDHSFRIITLHRDPEGRNPPDHDVQAANVMSVSRRLRTDTGVAFAQIADIPRRRGERVESTL